VDRKTMATSTRHQVAEHVSGVDRGRPEAAHAIGACKSGDVLATMQLDRLVSSVRYLLKVAEQLSDDGANFRSVVDPIDTTTLQDAPAL
jgi:DNA invertase Pin-like site-specific DNA recombinase